MGLEGHLVVVPAGQLRRGDGGPREPVEELGEALRVEGQPGR